MITNILTEDRAECPKHLSNTYYGVIVGGDSYKGWKMPDVGDGRMRAFHPDHADFKVNKGLSKDWMEECWNDFLEHADSLEK
jgi:hypothetical protein